MRKSLFFLLIMMTVGGAVVSAGDAQAPSKAVMYTLQQLSYQNMIAPEQLNAYLQGADAADVILNDGRPLSFVLKSADVVGIGQWTVDSGSVAATGGGFMMNGTAGQPDAGVLAGAYDLNGGFWGEPILVFSDGFESGDLSRWSSTVL